MRSLAVRQIGLGGLITLLAAGTLFAQNQPLMTPMDSDQPPSLMPSTRLILEPPREVDFSLGTSESEQRPSDGLGLRIYDGKSLNTPDRNADPQRLPDSSLPLPGR